jgi:hypothetical protein
VLDVMKYQHGENERDHRVKQDSTFVSEKGCRESGDKEQIGDHASKAFAQSGRSLRCHGTSLQSTALVRN